MTEGCFEYEVKLSTAGGQFASIVSKASGISLVNPYPYYYNTELFAKMMAVLGLKVPAAK